MHRFSFLIFSCIAFPYVTYSADLGIVAHTFSVREEGFTEMIKRKLSMINLEELQKKLIKKAKERVKTPKPVEGIYPAENDRVFHHMPIYEIDEDIYLPCGKLLYSKGHQINMLDHQPLLRRVIFIDARINEQVEWLKEFALTPLSYDGKKIEDRILLIGGSVFDVKEKLDPALSANVYFDQLGEVSTGWNIKATPSVVTQEKRFLKIQEIALERDKKENYYGKK